MKKLKAENMAADLGLDAALEGKSRNKNPYPPNTLLHSWWDIGWLESHLDDFGINKEID